MKLLDRWERSLTSHRSVLKTSRLNCFQTVRIWPDQSAPLKLQLWQKLDAFVHLWTMWLPQRGCQHVGSFIRLFPILKEAQRLRLFYTPEWLWKYFSLTRCYIAACHGAMMPVKCRSSHTKVASHWSHWPMTNVRDRLVQFSLFIFFVLLV